MAKIVGCMIVKNEEDYLEASINSFIKYVDRLIVVDDCSTDDTLEILSRMAEADPKIYFYSEGFRGDKTKQRNAAVTLAVPQEGDIVFFPDGDEIYGVHLPRFFWEFQNSNCLTAEFDFQHYWRDFIHEIKGHVWGQYLQRVYKWEPGLKYVYHNSISRADGTYLSTYTKEHGMHMHFPDLNVYHCSYVKPAHKIREKIRYYLKRDTKNSDAEVDELIEMHPYFSDRYDYPRYGEGGLSCCGAVDGIPDRVIKTYHVPPELRNHPNYTLYHDYALAMNKYMEEHWQFNNHLHFPHHQERLKYTAEFLEGSCVEIGCANGDSMRFLKRFNPEISIEGVEPTDWGSGEAKKNHECRQFYAENLPILDNSFDTVLLSEMIEHVQDPEPALNEAFRIAKKRVVITTPAKPHPDPDHKRVITPDKMRELLASRAKEVKICGLTDFSQPVRRVDNEEEIHFMIVVAEL